MPDLLTPDWLRALDDALRNHDFGAMTVAVQQSVTGTPHGDVVYVVRIDHGRARVEPGPGPYDVSITEDYATACALHRGELNAQQALMNGRITIGGDVTRLLAHGAARAAVGDVATALRERTTYPDAEPLAPTSTRMPPAAACDPSD